MLVERLAQHHDLTQFTCGVKALDDWLRSHALENQRRNLSRTFLLSDDRNAVAGYYSLSMGRVIREELPRHLGRGLPRYQLGMVLVARLAVDRDRQGQGLGRDLLIDAVIRAAVAGEQAAARFIAVDPIDEAARSFYRHFGFVDIDGDEHGRMFMRIDAANASIVAAGLEDDGGGEPEEHSNDLF